MKESDKEKYRETLEKSMVKIRLEIEELEELTQPISPENAIGRVSRMDAINNKSVNESALRKKRQILIRMNHNLNNIDKVDFGKCLRCKNPIPIERLLFIPETNSCTPCARIR
tara:strand:- start:1862 stop:2200 length:339 start_codon:yes stop_codon:yes gene_type:complete